MPSIVTASWPAQQAEHVRRLGQEPPHRQRPPRAPARRRASAAVTGSVTTQPSAISRTTAQCTWRQRRRPPPTPTTVGGHDLRRRHRARRAPTPPRSPRPSAPWPATPSSGCSRTIPRPIVRTIRQPPSAVPSVSAAAHATAAHVGEPSVVARPSATSSAAITPTDFCASLAPWPNASAAEVAHSPPRTGPRQRRVARRPARRSARIAAEAGDRAEHRRERERDEHHGDGVPGDDPGSAGDHARADQSADQRVAGTGGKPACPRRKVPRHGGRQRGRDHGRVIGHDDARRRCPRPPRRAAAGRAG